LLFKGKHVKTGYELQEKRTSGHEYALKSIILDRVSPTFVKELKNEIAILRSLDHPNIGMLILMLVGICSCTMFVGCFTQYVFFSTLLVKLHEVYTVRFGLASLSTNFSIGSEQPCVMVGILLLLLNCSSLPTSYLCAVPVDDLHDLGIVRRRRPLRQISVQ